MAILISALDHSTIEIAPQILEKTTSRQKILEIIERVNEESGFSDYYRQYKELKSVHAKLYDDFIELYNLSENLKHPDYLYRALCKEICSLVECDLYMLNKLHSYKGYDDRDDFKLKFKNTFKHFSKTAEVNNSDTYIYTWCPYFPDKYNKLIKVVELRHEYSHPKGLKSFCQKKVIEPNALLTILNDYHKFYRKIFGTM